MYWVKVLGRNLNLANADEILNEPIEQGDPRFEEGQTHAVQAIWLGPQEYEYILFAGSEQECDAFEEVLLAFLNADNLDKIIASRAITKAKRQAERQGDTHEQPVS